ncbi:MAG: 3-hydroxybutyryl-CoA dehydrogenase [Dehalococcoidia bacterium]|jgi:3-hydroxybutyryl-CoA dehydrogenase|nr:3-hydroxybutyryl-CoA dehydrogenase [Dehalococcoidia bacterium]
MDIKKVGIVGCGLMGSGIAEITARAGYDVVVTEVTDDFLKKGLARIESSTQKAVDKGKSTAEERAATLARIKGSTSLDDLKGCQMVIEAVVEKMDEKKRIFGILDTTCPPETILASNTSSLSITEIAGATRRPDKVIGLHFFSPVPVMRLLEVVRTIMVSDAAVEAGVAYGKSVGKETVVCKDAPGFIVNQLYLPYTLVALRQWERGLATKEDIDKAMQLGLNYPMGPFTLMDFVGLDIHYNACMAIYEETKDPAYFPPPVLKKMIQAGHLGRKTGKGFYDYGNK